MADLPYTIPRDPVVSSNIASIGFDAARKVLSVQFASGAIFHYASVDVGLFERLRDAESKGRFFREHVKGRFAAEKMTGSCPDCGDPHGIVGQPCESCGVGVYANPMRTEPA